MNEGIYTDIHMHVIPYVDDGADDFDDALAMLRMAREEGIRRVIATPHSGAFDPWRNEVRKNYELLKEKIADEEIDVELMLGAEIRLDPVEMKKIMRRIKKGKYPSLNGTNVLLIEFLPVEQDFYAIAKCIETIISAEYGVVIAHAERYNKISVEQIYELCEQGCLIQINYDDVIPIKGDRISEKANRMLKDRRVSYIATDAHHSYRRTPQIQEAIEYLYKNYDSDYVKQVLLAEHFG